MEDDFSHDLGDLDSILFSLQDPLRASQTYEGLVADSAFPGVRRSCPEPGLLDPEGKLPSATLLHQRLGAQSEFPMSFASVASFTWKADSPKMSCQCLLG